MNIEISDCEQGSQDWHYVRLGIPTASEFKKLLGIRKDAKDKATRREYMLKLAGEIITGEPCESYTNWHMERGKQMEPEARHWYAFMNDREPLHHVGFIRGDNTGCSPDSLVGENGLLEIKTNLPHILIDRHLQDTLPSEYYAQCQGALWITGREWIDLCCYWPKLPPFAKRIYPDKAYHKTLAEAVDAFNSELADIVNRIRARAA